MNALQGGIIPSIGYGIEVLDSKNRPAYGTRLMRVSSRFLRGKARKIVIV